MSEKYVKLCNPYLEELDEDKLYHIGFTSKDNLKEKFGDIKFVCLGGSRNRMQNLSNMLHEDLKTRLNKVIPVIDYTKGDRYSVYKVGPILCANHGMGVPSLSILLCELIKLLHYAEATDVTFFRIGTSGGIGVTPGTIVITKQALNHNFKPIYELPVLGKTVQFSSKLDEGLANELSALGDDDLPVVVGDTMCTNDFYEGQARLDGPFCDYTDQDKMQYLQAAFEAGVRNIEMECTCLAAMCRRAEIRAAILCCALLNRLNGDQVFKGANYRNFEERPLKLVSKYICGQLQAKQ